MILEFILNPIFEMLYYAFNGLDSLTFEIPTSFLGTLSMFLNVSNQFLPLTDLFIMSSVWFAIATFNIWWTALVWAWRMLPLT